MKEKDLIRKDYFKIRKALREEEVTLESKKICDNFTNNLLPNIKLDPACLFSLYFSAYNEVDNSLIADEFEKRGIAFSYPKILAKNSALKFLPFSKTAIIINSNIYKDVKEIDGNNFVEPNFLIIPLVSFDSNKMRLGMGGGFFDKTIENLKKKNSSLVTIGLAYDFQLFSGDLPSQIHDKKLDYVVTQTRIFS